MPVVMIPIHFDRDPNDKRQSCLRSFAIRPFLTNDFMTGLPAIPGRDLPEKVWQLSPSRLLECVFVRSGFMKVVRLFSRRYLV